METTDLHASTEGARRQKGYPETRVLANKANDCYQLELERYYRPTQFQKRSLVRRKDSGSQLL